MFITAALYNHGKLIVAGKYCPLTLTIPTAMTRILKGNGCFGPDHMAEITGSLKDGLRIDIYANGERGGYRWHSTGRSNNRRLTINSRQYGWDKTFTTAAVRVNATFNIDGNKASIVLSPFYDNLVAARKTTSAAKKTIKGLLLNSSLLTNMPAKVVKTNGRFSLPDFMDAVDEINEALSHHPNVKVHINEKTGLIGANIVVGETVKQTT